MVNLRLAVKGGPGQIREAPSLNCLAVHPLDPAKFWTSDFGFRVLDFGEEFFVVLLFVSVWVMACKVKLFVRRLCQDWDAMAEKLRRPWSSRDGGQLHQCCGLYLHFLDMLQSRAPAKGFIVGHAGLHRTFLIDRILAVI